jgi:metallo-beta-lactamase family protein
LRQKLNIGFKRNYIKKVVRKIAKKKNKEGIRISFVDEPASEDVTGSGVLVETPNHKILLDYGLAQSNDRYEDFLINNRKTKEFKAKDVDLIFISHLHADHCLKTPKLFKDGCNAGVIVSKGSLGVLKTMAVDSALISERDTLIINSQHNKKYSPIYSVDDVNAMIEHTLEMNVNEKIYIDEELSFQLIPSGHLLGGVQIVLYITVNGITKTIGYTGDIGNREIENYFVGKFQPIECFCDVLIGESTYGDRPDLKTSKKERKNDLDKLKSIIDTQIKEMKGRVLIPSFAQSRVQQLTLMIYQLYKNEKWQPKVYIDSPLAISIFKEYEQVLEDEEKKLFDELLKWDNLVFVKESEESKSLVSSQEPCLIISTSGMCQIGRVRHHLKQLIPNPNATVLFVGFSTPGSLASLLKDNKIRCVNIDQKEYTCRCASYSLKSMSGHAPYKQLLSYYAAIPCNKIILHHGNSNAKETLAKELKKELEKQCKTTRVVVSNSSLKFGL